LEITINGHLRQFAVPVGAMAIHVLRNDLGLLGVRMGCGEGHCGACMVHLDGKPSTTCDMPLWALEGKSVLTPEGVGAPSAPHPVQTALLQEQAGQCGFCLSGIVMTAVELVDRPYAVPETEVRAALDRHLCRCGTHHRIVRAVMRAIRQVHPE
jgi:nicotinate dehydrogenase subunit A